MTSIPPPSARPVSRDLTAPAKASRLAAGAIGVLLALAVAACGGGSPPANPPAPTVGVVIVAPRSVTLTTELPGRTSPYELADVRPQVGGIIQERRFTEGSMVRAGQVLYQIDPAPFQAAFDQARAQLANAEANLTTSRLKAERFADLVKIHAVSGQDNDDAQAAFKQAAANVEQQKAATQAARINLQYTSITAPIAGPDRHFDGHQRGPGHRQSADRPGHRPTPGSDLRRHHPIGRRGPGPAP